MTQLFFKCLFFFLSFLLKIYSFAESVIGVLAKVLFQLAGQIISFIWGKIKAGLSFIFRKIFSYFYNIELFEKLRVLFQTVFRIIWPFVKRIIHIYVWVNLILFNILFLLFLPCLILFLLPWEKIGNNMVHHEVISLGRLKELGLVAKAKIAAFFNSPPDLVTQPGLDEWKEHSVLCFMSYSLSILAFLAFFVSWGVLAQPTMQRVADFLYKKVYPEYADFVHSNYIGRYLHFVHDSFFIFIDRTFLIPSCRPDLEIYYRGDFIYYFLINLEDPYVTQFIPAFCFWIFVVSIVLCLPYETGFLIYFLLFRIVYVSMLYYLRQILLPTLSMRAIKKDFRDAKTALLILVKEYPSFVGELYVLISMTCFFSIGLAVFFL